MDILNSSVVAVITKVAWGRITALTTRHHGMLCVTHLGLLLVSPPISYLKVASYLIYLRYLKVALNQLFTGNSFTFSLPSSSPSVTISDFSCTEPPDPVCLELLEEDAEGEGKELPVKS